MNYCLSIRKLVSFTSLFLVIFGLGRRPRHGSIKHYAEEPGCDCDQPNLSFAGTISLSGPCGLADAILTANSDTFTGGCDVPNITGSLGDDTITLRDSILVDSGISPSYVVFPAIETNITIEGNNHSITRDRNGSSTHFLM